MLSVANALHWQRAVTHKASITAREVRRAYTARGNPKRKGATQEADTEWMAHVGGLVAPRDTLPMTDNAPLPRRFNAQGYIKPTPVVVPSKPVKRVSKLKKKSKKPVLSDLEDAKTLKMKYTDGSGKDAMMRDELAMREAFGRTGGRTPTGTYEDAVMESKKLEETQRMQRELRAAKQVDPYAHLQMEAENYTDRMTDDILVDDAELKEDWSKNLKRTIKAAKKVIAKKKALKKVSSSSSKVTKKVKKSSSTSSSKQDSSLNASTSSASASAPYDPLLHVPGKAKKFDISTLTYLEGSPEDIAMFGKYNAEGEQIIAPTATTRLKTRLSRKRDQGGGRKSPTADKVPLTEADAEAYLDQVQQADDKATQAYLDNYDQDEMMRPPIPTYTYKGIFRDVIGTSKATIDSMGTWVSLKTRGIRFEGADTLTWTVRDYLVSQEVATTKFKFHDPPYAKADIEVSHTGRIPMLDKFKLDFEIPVKLASVQTNEANAPPLLEDASIHVVSRHDGNIDAFAISLKMPDGNVVHPQALSIDTSGYPTSFDEQIKQIQHQLPAKTYLKTCWNCAFSEYNPIAKSTFGGLACFRNWSGIGNVRDKVELLRNWPKHLERVQETHHCESFKRRTKPRITGFNPTLDPNVGGIKLRKAELDEKKNQPTSL